VAKKRQNLKQEADAALTKPRLLRLRQRDSSWEADFRALPQPLTENQPHYLGLVVEQASGSLLAESQFEGRPDASDLAALLARAMQQPLTGQPHRPRSLHLRSQPQWRGLVPTLEVLGINVSVQRTLPKAKEASANRIQQMRDARRVQMVTPTARQAAVEQLFPAIARWVQGHGHIEIGDQESFGFVTLALDYGGVAFEDTRAETLAEAMAALEKGLAEYFKRERIE